jgi:hypothetical protein
VRRTHPENVNAYNECHKSAGKQGNPEIFAFCTEIYYGDTQAAYGHNLIGPAEVVPEEVESDGFRLLQKRIAAQRANIGTQRIKRFFTLF